MRRTADAISRAVVPLALAAVALALVAPSEAIAGRADLLLAGLVLLTALGIAPGEIAALRSRWRAVAALAVLPFCVLGPLAWAIGEAIGGALGDGTFALGLAPTEIATAGLVALAGGDAALVLAAITGSLVVSAVLGPLAVSVVAGADAGAGDLVGRFALVVLVPLAIGLAVRAAVPRIGRAEPELSAASAVVVCALVYAALSGADQSGLLAAFGAGAAFLAAAGAVAAGLARVLPARDRVTVPLAFALRDFAVSAALAEQAFGGTAASVSGAYGVLMLVAGAAVAGVARRKATVSPAGSA
ncbi:MAG: bile acid:sodium symporter [Solirubrobacteraceae bacterium]